MVHPFFEASLYLARHCTRDPTAGGWGPHRKHQPSFSTKRRCSTSRAATNLRRTRKCLTHSNHHYIGVRFCYGRCCPCSFCRSLWRSLVERMNQPPHQLPHQPPNLWWAGLMPGQKRRLRLRDRRPSKHKLRLWLPKLRPRQPKRLRKALAKAKTALPLP